MKKLLLIGIGAGNPEYLTVQAVNALNEVDVFFMMNKGEETEDLLRLRRDICQRYIKDQTYRIVEAADPARDRKSPSYASAVEAWHDQRATIYERLIERELGDEECGAFLIWGDPCLYDSTLRIIERVAAKGRVAFEYEVIPGISSVQALAARHKIALNRIGKSIHITTGRNLTKGLSDTLEDVVVMLDGESSFKSVRDPDIDIYWGAYIGTDDEILMSGKLSAITRDIDSTRAEAKNRKGWIMDTYLLRKASE
jgi:precorrin-6A synthase